MGWLTAVEFVGGLILLVVGAEMFVRGASRLAALLGVSALVIGLTVVAYGTSMPELAVSVQSSWNGAANIALGNVVGSSIANILLILGLSAAVAPLVVAQQVVRFDVPLMIAVSLLVFFFGWYGTIGRLEGLVLFSGVIGYTVFLIIESRRETNPAVQAEYEQQYGKSQAASKRTWLLLAGGIVGGVALLVLGSRLLVSSAVTIATSLGISDLIIGLTVVAVGTSLPELATSVVASMRGERDIAVGNVVGSNIFNVLMVLGASALLSPNGLPVDESALWFDIPVMIGAAVACLPLFLTGRLGRLGGIVFLLYYAAYLSYLVLRAGDHPFTEQFGLIMLEIFIPATIIWLGWVGVRVFRTLEQGDAS